MSALTCVGVPFGVVPCFGPVASGIDPKPPVTLKRTMGGNIWYYKL